MWLSKFTCFRTEALSLATSPSPTSSDTSEADPRLDDIQTEFHPASGGYVLLYWCSLISTGNNRINLALTLERDSPLPEPPLNVGEPLDLGNHLQSPAIFGLGGVQSLSMASK